MYVRFDIKTLFLRLPASDCTFVYICQMFGRNMKVSFLAGSSRCLQVFKRLQLELLWAPRLQNFSAILRIKMNFDGKTRSIQVNLAVWLFLSVLSYICVYIYICRSNMIKQSYSHSSFNYFYHATKPDRCIVAAQRPALHCRNCTVLRRMNLVWSTMKHPIHEIDSHGFAGGYCHSGLCSPVDLTSRSGQPAVQNLSYSKMVYCLSLRESMWVYLALPCLPSSFMYRIYPHCLGLKLELDPFQVGSVTGVKSHKAELVDALDFSCAQPNNGNGTDGTERQSHLFKPSFQAM